MQALKDVTMHEVGHTLGLRHNFKASTFYSIEEANDVSKTSKTGLTASVMDYTPVNMVPKDMTQGRLLLDDDWSLRSMGNRVRLHAVQVGRGKGTQEDCCPERGAGPCLCNR